MIAFLLTPQRRNALAGALLIFLAASLARANDDETVDGLFVSVANPITDAGITRIKNTIDRARSQNGRKVKTVVFDFNPLDENKKGNDAATDNFTSCLGLARYIVDLKNNNLKTVAFVHGKTTRHTVLPVLACNYLVMSSEGKIGDVAGESGVIPEDDAKTYLKIANSRMKEAVVLKMLNKDVEVYLATEDGNTIYVERASLDKPGFEKVRITDPNRPPVLPRGKLGLYNFEQANKFKLCDRACETKEAVAEEFHLSPASVHGGRGAGAIKAVKIELAGPIDEAMLQKLRSQFKEVRARDENMIFFVLDCGGGSAKAAREIADEIGRLNKDDKNDPVWTVAYIPNRAPDLAAFIAFACSEIVMFKSPDGTQQASLGDFRQFFQTAAKGGDGSNNSLFISQNLAEIATAQGYPKLVVDGLLDPSPKLVLVQDKDKGNGALELMTFADYEAAQKKKERHLQLSKTVKESGSFLDLNASQAKTLRIAQETVDNRNIAEVYTLYGLAEKDVRDARPSWIDDFAGFLCLWEISLLIAVVAFIGLILEFKMPGATVPGLISLVLFVLFFWSHAYVNGQTIFLAIALFVFGLILLGVEIFILPGFGVTGISGVLLILAGIGLATLEKIPSGRQGWTDFAQQLMQYGLSLVIAGIASLIFARYLPKLPYANRLMLVPPLEPEGEGETSLLPGAEQAAALLGLVGVATSMLRPAGMAKIGDEYVDVVTEGDFIQPGTPIQVIEVEGNRIVVKKV